MKRVLKWIGIVAVVMIGLVLIAGMALYFNGRSRLAERYEIEPVNIDIPSDVAALVRGEHLVTAVIACQECHGGGMRGEAFFNDPAVGTVSSSNLTAGEGGIGAGYTDEDWVRAIRHGVGPDGRVLLIMPSQHFQNLSLSDLGAIIAYLKTIPPVDNTPPATDLKFLTYVLVALGQFDDSLPAEFIDHTAPLPTMPAEGATAVYGEYLTNISTCMGCHGTQLAGGQPGPGEPLAPNLTPGGELNEWTEADFITLMRTGKTPTGRQVDPFMPWIFYQAMTDTELQAIWAYLQSLPALDYQGSPQG